ncbi:MAG: patatin-like phospholipase family protein [Trebonia sp.]
MSTALVIGGGGPLAMTWELGLFSGVAKSGVDLTGVNLTVGTSAGAAVGVWHRSDGVTDADVLGRLQVLGGQFLEQTAKLAAAAPRASILPGGSLMDRMDAAAEPGFDAAAGNRMIGQLALEAATIPEAAYVSMFEELVGTQWPSAFVFGATDIDSGELQIWDQPSGMPLGQAIAAGCAWPGVFPPVTIAGRHYMDGGVQDGMNPQLATGHDTVIAISVRPLAVGDDAPAGTARRQRTSQGALDDLERQGARVVLIEPDSRFIAVSDDGAALMDLSRIGAAYEAGLEYGAEVAERLRFLR